MEDPRIAAADTLRWAQAEADSIMKEFGERSPAALADERMGTAWDEALASSTPVVISVRTDPDVPPLPPHITLEQAKQFMHTLQQGDPDARYVIKDAAAQVMAAVTGNRGT